MNSNVVIDRLNESFKNVFDGSEACILDYMNAVILKCYRNAKNMIEYTRILGETCIPEFKSMAKCEQINKNHIYNVLEHTVNSISLNRKNFMDTENIYKQFAIENIAKDKREMLILLWALLLHDVGKTVTMSTSSDGQTHFYRHADASYDIAKEILDRINYNKEDAESILFYIKYHDLYCSTNKCKTMYRYIDKYGKKAMMNLVTIKVYDIAGQSDYLFKEKIENTMVIARTIQDYDSNKQDESYRLKMAINGNDLKSVGIPQGRIMGKILDKLVEDIENDNKLNCREWLIKQSKLYYRKLKMGVEIGS